MVDLPTRDSIIPVDQNNNHHVFFKTVGTE